MIAGSLPSQCDTYIENKRDSHEIKIDFYDQVQCLKSYVDFFYLDVISSSRECEIALNITSKTKLPTLVGLHLKANGKLPSGEKISDVICKITNYNIIGLLLSCVSPEIILQASTELNQLKIPYGFKANLWKINEPLPHTAWIKSPHQIGTNPSEVLGTREDYTEEMFLNFVNKMINEGATIIGGCCEVKPKHIKKISYLSN